MAGHSQFKNIMYRKGAQDSKRAKLFAKLAREITVAAKSGLKDPKQNPRLRNAIINARHENMPNDKIYKAIEKANSQADSEKFEEIKYEGFANDGIAVIIETLTDNRNRTASEIRQILNKNGGSLAESGAVSHGFRLLGELFFNIEEEKKEEFLDFCMDLNIEDILEEHNKVKVVCDSKMFGNIRDTLSSKFSEPSKAKLIWEPLNPILIDETVANKLFNILELLEENDDVQSVYSGTKISDDIIQRIEILNKQ